MRINAVRAFNVALSRRLSLHSRCEHVARMPLQLPALWSYLRLPHSQPEYPYTGTNSMAQAGHRSGSTVAGQRETVFSPAQQEKRAFQTDQLGSCHPGRSPCLCGGSRHDCFLCGLLPHRGCGLHCPPQAPCNVFYPCLCCRQTCSPQASCT